MPQCGTENQEDNGLKDKQGFAAGAKYTKPF